MSDIHGVKTGAQYPSDTTKAGTATGSTVPATAGYSGMCPALLIHTHGAS